MPLYGELLPKILAPDLWQAVRACRRRFVTTCFHFDPRNLNKASKSIVQHMAAKQISCSRGCPKKTLDDTVRPGFVAESCTEAPGKVPGLVRLLRAFFAKALDLQTTEPFAELALKANGQMRNVHLLHLYIYNNIFTTPLIALLLSSDLSFLRLFSPPQVPSNVFDA